MSSAKYIVEQQRETQALELAKKRAPKLCIEPELERALPKVLKQLSKEKHSSQNTDRCNSKMMTLIAPLLTNNEGEFITMKDSEERAKIKEALDLFVKIKSFKMLDEYHLSIDKILKMNLFWIKDISSWEWSSRNTYKQLKSLVEHLFCEYDVPEFMFQVWTEKTVNNKHLEWFLQLASGQSARNLFKFPIPITKKMAYEFINTPFPGYSIDDAVRRSQVMGMGGDERLANAVLMSRLRNSFDNNDFWSTVIQFFIGIPMLNLDEVGAIIDYINEQKFVSTRVVVNGIATYRPVNPNFTMKGRSLENLIRDTHAWHAELRQLRRQAGVQGNNSTTPYKPDLTSKWKQSSVNPFTFTEGSKDKRKVWDIKEITNAAELFDEGKSMHHCVYSYLHSCIKGSCSIFSLRLFGVSVVTIEVREYKAVQIRGYRNQRPTDKEIQVINDWAKKELIEITKYAIAGR